VQLLDVQGHEKGGDLPRADDDQPVGLVVVGGDLGGAHRRRDPDARGHPDLPGDPFLEVSRDRLDVLPVRARGHVEVRLVDAHLAHDVPDLPQDRFHLARDRLVELHVDGAVVARLGGVEIGVLVGALDRREALDGRLDALGALDPVLAGLVGGGGDCAMVRAGLVAHPDDDWLATKVGLPQALAGRVEAVRVDVTDDPLRFVGLDPRKRRFRGVGHLRSPPRRRVEVNGPTCQRSRNPSDLRRRWNGTSKTLRVT